MRDEELATVADLLRQRNDIDAKIAAVTGRPMASGHLGEWIAATVFDIRLESAATSPGFDGRFATPPLKGKTVNVKWYLKREGLLDVTRFDLDYYLVLTGPVAPATHSRGAIRPWVVDSVFLFDARLLLADLQARGVRIGVASSVRVAQWEAAEIYPRQNNQALLLSPEQTAALRRLGSPSA